MQKKIQSNSSVFVVFPGSGSGLIPEGRKEKYETDTVFPKTETLLLRKIILFPEKLYEQIAKGVRILNLGVRINPI